MTGSEVTVDGALADLAAQKAALRGERLDEVIERMLREYVAGDRDSSD